MSERGSFVTEYLSCDGCMTQLVALLCRGEKYLHGIVVPSWDVRAAEDAHSLPIIAGKLGALAQGQEWLTLVEAVTPATAPCHPVRMAVHMDNGTSYLLRLLPSGEVEVMAQMRKDQRDILFTA